MLLAVAIAMAGCTSKSDGDGGSATNAPPPDLSGSWIADPGQAELLTSAGKQPPLMTASLKIYESNKAARSRGENAHDSAARCVPPGVPRLALQPFPWDIVQGKRHVTFLYEWNHLHRNVYMAEGHFEVIGPTYLGQSVGKWEGATLEVHTHTFNDKTLLDDAGLPHGEQLETVERYRLIEDGQKLELKVTITDPEHYSASWDATVTFSKQPGVILKEDYCFRRLGIVK